MFYKSADPAAPVLDTALTAFHPFEPMRVGVHNITEALCALGHGNDECLHDAWEYLNRAKDGSGQMLLSATLTKSYLPKEKVGKPSKWVTFYTLLAEKERAEQNA